MAAPSVFRRPIPPTADHGAGPSSTPTQALARSLAACVLGSIHRSPDQIVGEAWPDDARAAFLTRAATSPDSTTSSASVLAITKTNPLLLVAPPSAAAKLFAQCLQLDLSGILSINVPHVTTHPVPIFVGEGNPIPVTQGVMGKATVGPTRKLAFITPVTRELNEATPQTASVILGRMMGEAAAHSLDTFVFDAQPADTTRPAGLLNGLTPLVATVAGSGIDAAAEDIAKFAAAFGNAMIDATNMILICNPREAWKLSMTRGFQTLPLSILMSPSIPQGTAIAVAPEAIGSAYDGLPQIETVSAPTLHMEDTNPGQIAVVGTPNVITAPTRSFWQSDSLAVKLRVKCAWAALQPGCVQFMSSVNW